MNISLRNNITKCLHGHLLFHFQQPYGAILPERIKPLTNEGKPARYSAPYSPHSNVVIEIFSGDVLCLLQCAEQNLGSFFVFVLY